MLSPDENGGDFREKWRRGVKWNLIVRPRGLMESKVKVTSRNYMFLLQAKQIELGLSPFPIRHAHCEQSVKRWTMIVNPQVAQLVDNDVIDTVDGSLHKIDV